MGVARSAAGLLGGLAAVIWSGAADAQPSRPMSVDDLFAIRTLTTVAPSPTGGDAAVVVQRSWSESPAFRPYNMMGNDQADIWLVSPDGKPRRNLTRGSRRNAGYWSPAWAPAGRRLAVLSTEGGDNVRLFIVDARTGQATRISERGVDTRAEIGATSDDPVPFRWLDDRRLLVALLPPGAQPAEFSARRQTASLATAGWREAQGGTRATVSVLSTDSARRPVPVRSSLVVIEVATRTVTALHDGSFADIAVTLDGSRLALVVPDTGRSVAILTIDTRTGTQSRRAVPLAIDQLEWSGPGRLLALARSPGAERADWWLLDTAGQASRNLTAALPSEPQAPVVPLADGGALVAAAGKLWRVSLDGGTPVEWGGGISRSITSIVWPRRREAMTGTPPRIAVSARTDGVRQIHDIDTRTGTASRLPSVEGRTRIAAFDPGRRRAWLAADRPDGTFLWTASAGTSAPVRALAMNQHLAAVATSRRARLRYRTATGDSLSATVLLPPDHVAGRRYPMVTWVYPGVVMSDTVSGAIDFWLAKNHAHADNLHVLAARGYAVLIPSMPVGGGVRDPYLELPAGVLPAVDAAIAAGIADSSRIAVMGQSAGGFATLGLITQTTRFTAAIAIAGYANLLSNYGTFDGQVRYRNDAHVAGRQVFFSEGDVIGMGNPPWRDIERYVRNSPVLHVERVRTPLLLIHGDLDYVPIQQSEEFFTALQRLGKPAEFARYWGESHGAADSTANARDRWERVLAWLDRWM